MQVVALAATDPVWCIPYFPWQRSLRFFVGNSVHRLPPQQLILQLNAAHISIGTIDRQPNAEALLIVSTQAAVPKARSAVWCMRAHARVCWLGTQAQCKSWRGGRRRHGWSVCRRWNRVTWRCDMRVFVCVYMCVCLYVCMCVCLYVCVCVCVNDSGMYAAVSK